MQYLWVVEREFMKKDDNGVWTFSLHPFIVHFTRRIDTGKTVKVVSNIAGYLLVCLSAYDCRDLSNHVLYDILFTNSVLKCSNFC